MKVNKNNFIINIFIILIVLGIVLYFSLKDDYKEIVSSILNMNKIYIIVAILVLILYRLIGSIAHYIVIKTNGELVSLKKCFQISFIVLFFHGVTPFSSGGQPMEVYYLHKEGIGITKSTNITLQNFMIYQISLVLVGVFAICYNGIYGLFPNDSLIKRLVVFGFVVNLLVLLISFILSFSTKISRVISSLGIDLLNKFNIIKDKENTKDKFNGYLDKFYKNAVKLKKNKRVVLLSIIINIVSILVLYSMPYFLGVGLGLDLSLIETIVATSYVMIIGSFVPIPGGTGGIEYGFVFFFKYLINGSILNGLMLVWRFISYYFGIILGAIFLSLYRKKEKK